MPASHATEAYPGWVQLSVTGWPLFQAFSLADASGVFNIGRARIKEDRYSDCITAVRVTKLGTDCWEREEENGIVSGNRKKVCLVLSPRPSRTRERLLCR